MAARNSSSSYQLRTLVTLLTRYKVMSNDSWRPHQTNHRVAPPYSGGSDDQGLRCLTSKAYFHSNLGMENGQTEEVQVQQTTSFPSKFDFSKWYWVKWVLGSFVSFLLPFWKNKWNTLLTLEGEAAKVVEEVEVVAEVVEKVATTAEKAAEEVEKQLPDNSKLKEAAQIMEHVSSVAARDAQLIENIINRVDDVKQDVEDLEKMVGPIVEKMIQRKHTGN